MTTLKATPSRDPLIGRTVLINADAVTANGNAHPAAGDRATLVARNPGKYGQYQAHVKATGETHNVALDAFTVLADRDLSPENYADAAKQVSSALAAQGLAEPDSPFALLSPDVIVASLTNPRHYFDPEALLELAGSIKLHGIASPLLVRRLPATRLADTFRDRKAVAPLPTHEIVAGERRWRASTMAGLREIPVLVRELTDGEVLELQLVENLQRKDLQPLEEAEGFRRLFETKGYTVDAIADKVHKSRSYVYETIKLLVLQGEAREALESGHMSRSVARLLARIPGEATRSEAASRVMKGPDGEPLSVRAARDLIQRHYMLALASAPFSTEDAQLLPIAGACMACPKRTGANPDLFADLSGADTCTDTLCFAAKREAWQKRTIALAIARGQEVIVGPLARELMPFEGSTPAGYILLDKPAAGCTETPRTLLGAEVAQSDIVLIETPSGAFAEAIRQRTHDATGVRLAPISGISAPADAPAEPPITTGKTPTRQQLEAAYASRVSLRMVAGVADALDPPLKDVGPLPASVLAFIMERLAEPVQPAYVQAIFGLREGYGSAQLHKAIAGTVECEPNVRDNVLLMLTVAAAPANSPLQHTVCELAGVDVEAIQALVKAEMKAEAAAHKPAEISTDPEPKRAATKPGAYKPRPPKTTTADATRAIAEALQAADAGQVQAEEEGTQEPAESPARVATQVTSEAEWPFPMAGNP